MSDQPGMAETKSSLFPARICFLEDYPAVLVCGRRQARSVGRSDKPDEIAKKLKHDPDLFLVAERDGRIVGSVLGGFDGRRGMVYHLAVAQSERRLGIGEGLMTELENRLRQKGCIRSYLLVTQDNKDAIRFYEKRDWEQMDTLYAYAKDL
jgi:ribosomal protein S18 acetylase RimI-like enzyme